MANISTPNTTFPFSDLSPELRIMVYRELLVSSDCHLNHCIKCPYHIRPPIYTALLRVNRQIHNEASAVLYTQNKIILHVDYCCNWCWRRFSPKKVLLRTDNSSGGLRKLRSGRTVDTMRADGQIYPHVLKKFTQVEIRLSWVANIERPYPGSEDACSVVLSILEKLLQALCATKPVAPGTPQGSLVIEITPRFNTEEVSKVYLAVAELELQESWAAKGLKEIGREVSMTRQLSFV